MFKDSITFLYLHITNNIWKTIMPSNVNKILNPLAFHTWELSYQPAYVKIENNNLNEAKFEPKSFFEARWKSRTKPSMRSNMRLGQFWGQTRQGDARFWTMPVFVLLIYFFVIYCRSYINTVFFLCLGIK